MRLLLPARTNTILIYADRLGIDGVQGCVDGLGVVRPIPARPPACLLPACLCVCMYAVAWLPAAVAATLAAMSFDVRALPRHFRPFLLFGVFSWVPTVRRGSTWTWISRFWCVRKE